MVSNVFYLTMSFYYFYVLALLMIAAPAALAHHLRRTHGEGRRPDDVVPAARGRRRRDVRPRRGRGASRGRASTVDVVSPAQLPPLRHRLRRRDRQQPARGAVEGCSRCRSSCSRSRAPRAARRATPTSCTRTGCPSALPALATGKPFVLQLWGSDVALARRVRPLARRARPSRAASSSAPRPRSPTELGARRARRARDPERRRDPRDGRASPTSRRTSLYVGRLSEEKGVRELAEAADGLPLVVVGDGPLRVALPAGGRLRAAVASSVRTTSVPRSSSCRRGARATAWSRARRWRTGGRWSRRLSAASSTRSRTASPASSCPGGDDRALRAALERLLADAELRAAARCGRRGSSRRPALLLGGDRGGRRVELYDELTRVSRCGSGAASSARAARREP